MTGAIARLLEFGQSPWYDNLTRALATGGLRVLVEEHGIRGVTSNPTIFEKAMALGGYDDQLREVHASGAADLGCSHKSRDRFSGRAIRLLHTSPATGRAGICCLTAPHRAPA